MWAPQACPRPTCKFRASFLQGTPCKVPAVLTLEPIVLSSKARIDLARIKGRAEVASVISEAIERRAAEFGLGAPLGDVTKTPDGLGWCRKYPAGWVVYRADRGAKALYGAIGARWIEFGGTQSFLGWPATDQLDSALTIDRIPGHHTRFDGGIVIWSGPTGAFELHGEILELWRQLGAESGALGLPLSDEHDLIQHGTAVGRRSVFQHGEIGWSPEAGAAVTFLSHPYEEAPGASTARVRGLGGGGDEPPLPAVRRFLRGHASIAITRDDFGLWEGDAQGSASQRVEAPVDSWDPATITTVVGTPDEVQVEVVLTTVARPDGSVLATGHVVLRDRPDEGGESNPHGVRGTEASSPDLAHPIRVVIPRDDGVTQVVHIARDWSPDDHAEVLISLWNHPV